MHEFPASPMQIAVYNASLSCHSTTATNTQISINFGENVEISLIQRAWKWLTLHHGLLRSSFKRPNSKTPVALREHVDCGSTWHPLDWSKIPNEEIGPKWQLLQVEDATRPIDLTNPPLYHFHVIKLAGDTHHFLWTFHSILLDEESVFLILRDWLKAYTLLCKGDQLPPSQGALSYAAVVGAIENTDTKSIKQYWKDTFAHFSSWSPLRPLYSRRLEITPPHSLTTSYTEFFDRETTAKLRLLLTTSSIPMESATSPPFLILLIAAWGLVLARTHVEGDTIFGVYRSCRSLAGSQASETVGLFDTLLPIRIKVPENLTCKEWFQQLQKEELAVTPYLLSTPEEVWATAHTNLEDHLSFFDSTLHYLPTGISDRISKEIPEWIRFDARLQKASTFPIRIIAHGEERLSIAFEYNSEQISPALARQFFDRLLLVIQSFEKNPNHTLSEISILLPQEEENLLEMRNSRNTSSSPHLFTSLEDATNQSANLPAVEYEKETLNFSQIETYSRQLAEFLKKNSQPPKSIIAIAMNPSPRMFIGLLGILKANCICLILDPNTSSAELRKIFTLHKVSAVLTDTQRVNNLGKFQQPFFVIDQIWNEITSFPTHFPLSLPEPSDPALFLLQPNGERWLVSHEMLQISLKNAIRTYNTKPGDRILCHSLQGSPAFVEEFFVALLTGATLVIPGKNVKTTRTAFQKAIEVGSITHLRITSVFWSQWIHYLNELGHSTPSQLNRLLIEAGHISPPIIESWKKLNKEGVDCITFHSPSGLVGLGIVTEPMRTPELTSEGVVCGQPQPGIVAFITDCHHRPLPFFFPGILFLSLTIPPLEQHTNKNGISTHSESAHVWKIERARWNEKKQLILISQPHASLPEGMTWKELWQIEDVLTSHPDLMDGIVRKISPTEDTLCAWIVPRDSHGQFPTTLESHLSDHSPHRKIPTKFALITRFNLNASDLVDEKTLPQPGPVSNLPTLSSPTTSESISSPIITLQTAREESTAAALYFIHAGRGLVEDYRPIAQALSEGYTVHCLMIPRKGLAPSNTVEEITRQLIPTLRLHASGKFAIVGIGTGAVFAWELACQLDSKNEMDVPVILFEVPSIGNKDTSNWLYKIKKNLFGNPSHPPQGHFAELIAAYQPPVVHQRKPYFFATSKPDPEWRRCAPFGVWEKFRLTNSSLLDEPEEIANILKGIFSSNINS